MSFSSNPEPCYECEGLREELKALRRERDALQRQVVEWEGVEGRCPVGHNKRFTSMLLDKPVCVACERDEALAQADGWMQTCHYAENELDDLVFLLKSRFPLNPDGTQPDWKIEDVLEENRMLREERDRYRATAIQGDMFRERYERAQNDLAEMQVKAEAIAKANDQLAHAHFEMQTKLQRAREALRDIAEGDAGWLEIAEEALADLAEGGDGKAGWCCACGEGPGPEETPCPKREDKIHCECWWDGEDEGGDDAKPE